MKDSFVARLYVLVIAFTGVGVLILFQMGRVQFTPGGKELAGEIGLEREFEYVDVTSERGGIYDRYGHILAGNKEMYELGVNLAAAGRDPETIATVLAQEFGMDYKKIHEAASTPYVEGGVRYVVIENFIEPEKISRLEQLKKEYNEKPSKKRYGRDEFPPNLNALEWTPHLQRIYPENSLASNILGFYSFRQRRDAGAFFGVEAQYDRILAGVTQKVKVPINPNKAANLPEPPPGASLVLTIDREIQRSMEEVISRAVESSKSESGTLIVLDPKTGEIIAMASTPNLDLNQYWTYDKVFPGSTPFNRAISQTYEPGSVFKVLTMAAGLDAGKVKPDTQFIDTGSISIGGITIYNWDRGAWGPQDMVGCMQHSLNVCLTWVATQLGPKDFYKYMDAFGIGRRTKVDLAGEVNYPLSVPGDPNWYEANLGTNSFGQSVAATPLQMASAISALANNGKMMAPHIVKAIVEDGRQRYVEPVVIGQPISAETAHTITEMLAVSLEQEASDALVPGYRVAGKTGTGEIPSPEGYVSNLTNASFVGWGPTDDPRFLVYLWLEKPQSSPWGSVVAAPVFSEATQKLVALMQLPPDDIRLQLYAAQPSSTE